jgi:outer membrane protein assembly factor BamB
MPNLPKPAHVLETVFLIANRRRVRQASTSQMEPISMPKTTPLLLGIVTFTAFASLALAVPNDWSQWRGPNREDISHETGLLKSWPEGGPKLTWKVAGIGTGYSGVSVVGSHIFTMGDMGDASYALALNVADGKIIWKSRVGKSGGNYTGPRCTPTVDGQLLYVLGQFGDLVCLQVADGKEVWRKDYVKDFGGRGGGWNFTESPLVDGDRLVCTPGGASGAMVALNKKTGALIWQAKEFTDKAEYSSPILAQIAGVNQYVQLTGESVVGIATADGKLLWRAERKGRTATIPTPIVHKDHVYVTSGYGVGCNLFKITKTGSVFKAEQVYANKNMVNHHGGVVLVGEHLYGFSDGKGWVCQEFLTGNVVWSDKGVGKGSLTCADGRLYLRNESGGGRIALIEATPASYKETGSFEQPDRSKENSWPHPVIANGKLYIRDQDILLCYEVKP